MSEGVGYDELIMDHIKNARNFRALLDGTHEARGANPLCGDDMLISVRLTQDQIADIGFQCTCCGISMASASIMTELVKGTSRTQAARLVRDFLLFIGERAPDAVKPRGPEWGALLDTTVRYPARLGCATLAWTTLQSALE
jgi:nitrogen fixation NifU-like protein